MSAAKKLRLWVDCANYSNYSDHAAWINARLTR
ncbi:MAG: NPCBM/NEW2 domain-containing protein [Ignavibacteriales bacterium]|nr:NPCBM/NEW2 domain-containing protein [Ignavibacteriales bacterium]